MSRLALVTACLVLLAGCGGSGGAKPVAHVGGDTISTKQLDALMAHFKREAQRGGSAFPAAGTVEYRKLQSQALGLLVYRTELKQAAERLGVKVDQNELTKRLAAASGAGGEQEGDTNGDTFARDSVEAQLLTEGIAAKVTHGTRSAAVRNRKLAAYLQQLQVRTKVRYEPGYGPGS